jgi:hypothetical protein
VTEPSQKRRLAASLLVLVLGVATSTALSQQEDLQQLVAKRDKKLAASFLRCSGWTTNYDDARLAAKSSGKLILGYFTRSYAPCGPCVQLEQCVFSQPDFVEFSKSMVLFCHISTHIPSEPHGGLFAEKGGTAFPTVMVLDADGNVLARQCGERSLRAVCDAVDQAKSFACLIGSSATADADTRYCCLLKQIELGHFTPPDARAKVKALGALAPDRETRLHAAVTAREFALAVIEIRRAPDDAGRLQAAGRLVEMKKAGHIPADGNAIAFWDWVIAYAEHARDPGLYEDGLTATKRLLPDDAGSRELCREREATLDRMRREVRAAGSGMAQKN